MLLRGWCIVGASCAAGTDFWHGLLVPGVFASIQAQFGASSFSTACISSLRALIDYAVGVFSGAWSDRITVRTVTSAGIVPLSLVFVASSLLTSPLAVLLWVFCALFGLGVVLAYAPAVSTIRPRTPVAGAPGTGWARCAF